MVETFWSFGMKGEKLELGRKTVPLEYLLYCRSTDVPKNAPTPGMTLRDIYEMVANRWVYSLVGARSDELYTVRRNRISERGALARWPSRSGSRICSGMDRR